MSIGGREGVRFERVSGVRRREVISGRRMARWERYCHDDIGQFEMLRIVIPWVWWGRSSLRGLLVSDNFRRLG
jgi:hypothetical protein